MCWQSLGSLQQKAIDQITLGDPRKKDYNPHSRGGHPIYVSFPIQGSSGDLKQILAICICHRQVQFQKQCWFMTTRFLFETTKPEAVPCKLSSSPGLHWDNSSSIHPTSMFRKLWVAHIGRLFSPGQERKSRHKINSPDSNIKEIWEASILTTLLKWFFPRSPGYFMPI